MSVVMMDALKVQVASLTRQVETLAPENERVRKLLTEFDVRHDKDKAEIDRLRGILGMAVHRLSRAADACADVDLSDPRIDQLADYAVEIEEMHSKEPSDVSS